MEIIKSDSRMGEALPLAMPPVDIGIFTRSCLGEVENGDQAALLSRGGYYLAVVFDGLGHGPKASQAARLAVRICKESEPTGPLELLALVNDGLKNTVGAAGAILRMQIPPEGFPHSATASLAIQYCAIGNISARLVGDGVTRLVGTDGVLGAFRRKTREHSALLGPGGLILLNTDGVQTDSLPRDLGASAKELAKSIVNGYGRTHDDATALVIKVNAG